MIPDVWIVSKILEEGLAPDIVTAIQQPYALALEIMELRTFDRARTAVDGATGTALDAIPEGARALVFDVDAVIMGWAKELD